MWSSSISRCLQLFLSFSFSFSLSIQEASKKINTACRYDPKSTYRPIQPVYIFIYFSPANSTDPLFRIIPPYNNFLGIVHASIITYRATRITSTRQSLRIVPRASRKRVRRYAVFEQNSVWSDRPTSCKPFLLYGNRLSGRNIIIDLPRRCVQLYGLGLSPRPYKLDKAPRAHEKK